MILSKAWHGLAEPHISCQSHRPEILSCSFLTKVSIHLPSLSWPSSNTSYRFFAQMDTCDAFRVLGQPSNWLASLLGQTINIWPNRSALLLASRTAKLRLYMVLLCLSASSSAFLKDHQFHHLLRKANEIKNKSNNWPNTHTLRFWAMLQGTSTAICARGALLFRRQGYSAAELRSNIATLELAAQKAHMFVCLSCARCYIVSRESRLLC